MDALDSGFTARLERLRPELMTLFHEGWKYLLVSALALAVDLSLFWLLVEKIRVYYLAANAVSVLTGLIVNYLLSVAFVFKQRRLTTRRAEFVGFIAIGLVGLAVNEGCVAVLVGVASLGPILSKLAAAGVSFVFNFVTRRLLLFTARR